MWLSGASIRVRCVAPAVLGAVILACTGCYPYNPPDSSAFAPCCGSLGTCIPEGLIAPEVRSRVPLDTCQPDLLCVPTALAENSKHVAKTCRATGGAEGRCMASCLPDVVARADQLQRDLCEVGESCVPCFDPRNGEDTGICHLGADPGPVEPARVFATCCQQRGRCVPSDVISGARSGADLDQLGPRDCPDPNTLCVDASWLSDKPSRATECRSIGGLEGRCIARCITQEGDASDLPRGNCAQDEACAPCYDPLTGADTQACRQGDDVPKEPAAAFPDCCVTAGRPAGRCVPRDLVEATDDGLTDRLGRDSCRDEKQLCVPTAWLDDADYVPAKCIAGGELEGRCLPSCLPDVAARAENLQRWSCAQGSLCVPCFDPISGEDSQVCRMGTDAPEQPPTTFETCCGTGERAAGRCVPRALIGEDSSDMDISALGRDTCRDSDALCVPDQWLDPERDKLEACVTFGTFEGRCLPSCLLAVSDQAGALLRETCAQSDRCVPCYDPLTGKDSGACRSGDDEPTTAPHSLPGCCGSGAAARGRCVPVDTLVQTAGADLARFGRDSCADTGQVCVPERFLESPASAAATRCQAAGDIEGRCLSSCLPEVAARAANLERAQCEDGDLCVPCYDPRDGTDTMACRSGSDQPEQPPETFPTCCGSGAETHGRCLPSALLQGTSPTLTSHLGRDTCQATDALCVPQAFLGEQPAPPAMCRSIGDLEGRCVPACLPEVAVLAERLTSRGCESHELCAPCYDPRTVEETGVCTLNGDQPREEPRGFARCCGTGRQAKGTCVPAEILSEGQSELLPFDTCRTYDARCVPTQLTETPPPGLPECDSILGRGVCLEACFLGSQGDLLTTSSCASDQRCVPCSSVRTQGIGCE